MKVFTIQGGVVSDGAVVESFRLTGAGVEIPAIIIGSEGRGRSLGVLPIGGVQPNQDGKYPRLAFAMPGLTRAGKPNLFSRPEPTEDDRAIVVLRTGIGFRGGNSHTGDRSLVQYEGPDPVLSREISFEPFPGEILARGGIAQGDAGRMGSGEQLVAVIPRGIVFRTGYSGRLYGSPAAHCYVFDGEKIVAATWEERRLADLF